LRRAGRRRTTFQIHFGPLATGPPMLAKPSEQDRRRVIFLGLRTGEAAG
jgi:hypothetical protein